MQWLYLALGIVVLLFGSVLLFGPPYLPTLGSQVEAALDMLDLAPGQRLLELGCGDGKVLVAAAERGWTATGYEINPLLALVAWLRTRRYGGAVKVVWGNFWRHSWPPAEGIFVFILQKNMSKLDKKIVQEYRRPVRLVSFAFHVPGRRPSRHHRGVYLYQY